MDMMSYLMGRNSGGAKKGVKIEVVTELPETGEANVIYLVPKETEDENNVFDEYLYINDEWELIGTTDIDISGKQDTMQFSTMPNASADYLGKIVQYTGTTNANYTNGYFYIGITDGAATPTYGWSNIEVQDAPSIDGSTIKIAPSGRLWELDEGFYTYDGMLYHGVGYGLYKGKNFFWIIKENSIRKAYIFTIDNNNISRIMVYKITDPSGGTLLGNIDSLNNITSYNLAEKFGINMYQRTTTYQIGDYVWMTAKNEAVILYKCNTADTTGNWDSSKWTQVTYMEYLSDTLVGGALNGSY